MFTQGLSQIEGTLNKVFAEQKADRAALDKKYRYVKYKVGIYRIFLKQY